MGFVKIFNQKKVMAVYPFALLLGHANSAVNPLLYCWMTRNIRRTVLATLSCCRPKPKPRHPTDTHNNTNNQNRKHSCKICCRFTQPRKNGAGMTSSSGYESCGVKMQQQQQQGGQGPRCLVLTTIRRSNNRMPNITTTEPALANNLL